MAQRMTDEQQKNLIMGYYKNIELAVRNANEQMQQDDSRTPGAVGTLLEIIEYCAKAALQVGWPDPAARAAQAAKQDAALQKLINRASKPTPIRATKRTPIRAA